MTSLAICANTPWCCTRKSLSSGGISAYAPITKALTTLDARTEEAIRKKFEIVYFLVKENLPSFVFLAWVYKYVWTNL